MTKSFELSLRLNFPITLFNSHLIILSKCRHDIYKRCPTVPSSHKSPCLEISIPPQLHYTLSCKGFLVYLLFLSLFCLIKFRKSSWSRKFFTTISPSFLRILKKSWLLLWWLYCFSLPWLAIQVKTPTSSVFLFYFFVLFQCFLEGKILIFLGCSSVWLSLSVFLCL